MKKNFILLLLMIACGQGHAQYLSMRAKYIDSRLVDDFPNPPKRENRLLIEFYYVSPGGQYSIASLNNFDFWIYKEGLHYGNGMGGVLDSTGNNYPGYPWTAPKVVSYYNSLGPEFIDCLPSLTTHYLVNGSTLDAGWVNVSYWDIDGGTGNPIECFTAPQVCIPYYQPPHPYYYSPGNVNFDWSVMFPAGPYNLYNFNCGGPQQTIMRGLLPADTVDVDPEPLPVKFAYVKGTIGEAGIARISFSNLTESEVLAYEVQKADTLNIFQTILTLQPKKNNGEQADYELMTEQTESTAFYRVKAVELSGKVYYSSIIRLSLPDVQERAEESLLRVYPNPVNNGVFTYRLINADRGRYIAMIVTPDGKAIKQKMIEHAGGDMSRMVELAGLPKGIYQLVIRGEHKKISQAIAYVN